MQSLGESPAEITVDDLMKRRIVQDDRIELTVTDGGVFFNIDPASQYQ